MNSILLLSRSKLNKLINNENYFKLNFIKNQRKNFSTKNNSPKSNPQTNQQSTNLINNNTRNLVIAGVAITSLLGGYYLIKKPSSENIIISIENDKKPKLIDDLPENIEYLIIGGGSAAFAALRTIRANEPKSKVIVISNENNYPYMRPPLSKELWFAEPELQKNLKFKQWNNKERSIFYAHEEFYFNLKQLNESETGGVTVLKEHQVVKLDPYDQIAILDNGQTLKYGKCLIATGSRPIKNKLEDSANEQVKKRILNYGTIDDFKNLTKLVEQGKSIALIGSEFLASELVCALTKINKKGSVVQIMEGNGNLTTVLPEFLSEWTSKCLQNEGIKQLTSTQIKSTDFMNDQVVLNLSNGEQLKTDYLIIDNGAEPNIDLAKTSGLEICPLTGGLLVNAEMQARTNLWVAGDVASYYDERLGRRKSAHHDNALVTGRLAGDNMSGKKKVFYHQPLMWSDLGPKIGFEAIGLIDSTLPTISVFTKPEKQPTPETKSKPLDPEEELAIKLPNKSDDFHKGVVFYIKEGIVVGVLLWNVFSKTMLARRVINENKSYEDLNELAKLFDLHKDDYEDLEDN